MARDKANNRINGHIRIPMAGIYKDNKHQTIYILVEAEKRPYKVL
jgi:hypothetical protein